jgi:hypothetical protein
VIEAYAFIAMFAVQVLTMSVVHPNALIRYVRNWAKNFGTERFAQMYPGVDYPQRVERFAKLYRRVSAAIAALGALLLAWLLSDMQRADWLVEATDVAWKYYILQLLPLAFFSLYVIVRNKRLARSAEDPKRKAVLQRRGLFDFVSPWVVALAAFSYVLFIAFAIFVDLYVYKNVQLSGYSLRAIGTVSLVYAFQALVIYKYLYGKRSPLVTHEGRAYMIGTTVRNSVYGAIFSVWFFMLIVTLKELDVPKWHPFALSFFFVLCSLLSFMGVTAPPRKPDSRTPGASNEVLS